MSFKTYKKIVLLQIAIKKNRLQIMVRDVKYPFFRTDFYRRISVKQLIEIYHLVNKK